ncbi:MAG: Outer-rane lipoprotein carrier protein [Pseudomonadota bacterium]|jgi:outer membrane lipoprotein carrier protein
MKQPGLSVVRGLVLMLCFAILYPVQAGVVAVDSSTAALEKRLSSWDNFEANFTQNIYGDTEELVDSVSGKVYLKKPGKLRWEVNSKDKSLIVSDGKKIWHYDPELQQATVDAFDVTGTSPLLFLSTKTQELGKHFVVKAVSSQLCGRQADSCFEMTPHQADEMFQWIRVGFAKEALTGLEFFDQLGQHGWITFKEMKVNKPMSESLFDFIPPKGTDVVRRS